VQWRQWLIGAFGLLWLVACTQAPAPPAAPFVFQRSVDLSHVIRQDAPHLPAEPLTRLERASDGRLQSLILGARTGTFLEVVPAPDAPLTVDLLSPRDLVLEAVVIDVRDRAQDTPGYTLSTDDILTWEERNGAIPPGALVLLATGWDVRWGDATAYLALDSAANPQTPTFSPAAVELLLSARSVAGLGIDAPTVPTLAAAAWLALMNLTNLEQLPPRGTTVVIGALKVQAGDRSPARVVALIVEESRVRIQESEGRIYRLPNSDS
jgi:kynurenine formamidase